MWPHPWMVFSKTGTCSKSQPQQREEEGAQQSVRTWRVAAPVPLSCLIPHFYIIMAFHMFTSHFPLLVLTLACPSRKCWLEARFFTHHGGARNVLVALRATMEGLKAAEPFPGSKPQGLLLAPVEVSLAGSLLEARILAHIHSCLCPVLHFFC